MNEKIKRNLRLVKNHGILHFIRKMSELIRTPLLWHINKKKNKARFKKQFIHKTSFE